MAVTNALIFVLLVASIQGSLATYKAPISSFASHDLQLVLEKERDAILKGVRKGILTQDDADDAIKELLAAAKTNTMTILTKVDLGLGKAVQGRFIDEETRAKILLHGIARGLHLREFGGPKDAVANFVDSAKKAGIITESYASRVKSACPSTIVPFGGAAVSADHVV